MGISLLRKRAILFWEMIKYKITGKRKPLVVYLLLTDECNRRCRYCFVDCSQKKKELSLKQWKKIIDTLVKKGTKMICLMGGEPLVYPFIGEIVDYIVGKGVICDMTSNGILVKQKIETVKKLDGLMISLDGDQKANDANRGEGAFSKAIEAIRAARQNGICVRVNAVLTQQSRGSLKFLLDLAEKYNLFVTYSILADFPEKEGHLAKRVVLSDSQIKQIYKKLKKWKSAGKRILFSTSTIDYVIDYPLPYNQIVFKNSPLASRFKNECLFGRVMFYIDSDGSFYPCAALWNSKSYQPFNIAKHGFGKAWKAMGKLECQSCFCPGVPEWNHIMSPFGIVDGIRISLTQIFGKKMSL